MYRVLVTTTSFQDTPGPHHKLLEETGYDVVYERGPLNEFRMLELAGGFDAFLCGDDDITRSVMEKSLPRLRVIAKYGIGLDKIDVNAATELKIPVTFTPGVNHTAVAEQVFALLLGLTRNLVEQVNRTRRGSWKRDIGTEIYGKSLGIVGLGRIGREVAVRARAFGLKVRAYDVYWDQPFAQQQEIERCESVRELFSLSRIVSLHSNLTPETREMVNRESLQWLPEGAYLINCGRGELVNTQDVCDALYSGYLGGYGADVLDIEPPPADHPLLSAPRCLVSPHVGSRTYESVERQADMALRNLILVLDGRPPLAQANQI